MFAVHKKTPSGSDEVFLLVVMAADLSINQLRGPQQAMNHRGRLRSGDL